MNKIVREHYPVEKLPKELRDEVQGEQSVRLTLETSPKPMTVSEVRAMIDKLRASPDFVPRTSQDIVAEIRALRDEWDD